MKCVEKCNTILMPNVLVMQPSVIKRPRRFNVVPRYSETFCVLQKFT